MNLIPYPIGPLNPRLQDVLVALFLFGVVFLFMARVLSRMNLVLEERGDAIEGTKARAEAIRARAERERATMDALLAEARHEAARTRQQAFERGTALIAEARADGRRRCDALLAENHARIASERATAETELRMHVSELASDLASRIVGERIPAGVEQGG